MKAVLKSCRSLAIRAVAAFIFAAGRGFAGLAWATMPEFSPGHYIGYYRADGWLHAIAFLSISGTILLAGWTAVRSGEGRGEDRAETVGAVVAGLIVPGGYGRVAATAPYDSSGHLTVTIGLALMSPLALRHGAHHNAATRAGATDTRLLSLVWSAASLGLLLNAVGYDFVPVGVDARTNGIVGSTLAAVGTALVARAVMASRSQGWLSSR